MMLYPYKCEECEYEEDFEFSMAEEKPKRIKCPECSRTAMYRVFGQSTLKVPFDWNDTTYSFNKSPSGRKHFY